MVETDVEMNTDKTSATPPHMPHEGTGRVLGKILTLALFLGALGWIAQSLLVSTVDGAAKQREFFGDKAPPFGLVLASAVRLPTGDTVVRFTRAAGAEDEGALPADVLFLEYQSRAAVEALLRPSSQGGEGMGMDGGPGARLKEWEKEKAFDWSAPVKRGEIAWGDWSSKLLIERNFKKGGGWSEEARVDLSSPQRVLALCARWSLETPADEKVLRELLLAITLAPPGS